VLSREMFIRSALVEGDWDTHHAFFAANRTLLDDVEELEHRARRRDIVVDDEAVHAFYDARIPADVVSGRHFDAWWKRARHETPDLLTFTMADLVSGEAAALSALDHPDVWVQGDLRLPLTYQFEPGSDADGVTVHIPVDVLNQVSPEGFDWQVPGLRQELVTALVKSLPKPLRVRCVPAPDTAAHVLAVVEPRSRPLLDALETELLNTKRVDVRAEDWQLDKVPDHLRMTFRVEDARGRTLAEGKDLDALKASMRTQVQQALSAASTLERSGLTSWDVGTLPREVTSGAVKGFPALVDEGTSVSLRVLGSPAEQAAAHWRGVRRLLLLALPSPVKALQGRLTNATKLALTRNPHGSVAAVLDDCALAAADALVRASGGVVWDAAGFERLREAVRPKLVPALEEVLTAVTGVLSAWYDLRARLDAEQRPALATSVADMRAQLDRLVRPGFVTATGFARLADVSRSLQALDVRLRKLPDDPARDRLHTAQVARVQAEVDDVARRVPPSPELEQVRWMVEELRISLFAQPMRTRGPVSDKRIARALDALLP
jgi:ATP-dependent helicase HrpA